MLRVSSPKRRGVVTVEAALVFPIVILLLLGLIVGAMGIFRYQQVAWLAREGARYASVRGTDYQLGVPGAKAVTPQDVFDNVIYPNATILDRSSLGPPDVKWSNKSNTPYVVNVIGDAKNADNAETPTTNTVTVTVTYTWIPEIFFIGPITLSSSSTLPMSY
ncbi:MAG TPA: TadE/TadG family type IV pilus assembly protein [Gemmataceae bacterium]|nr:TadE/TadG family type IV pilus assembly protein [Gemmataceae bacterium]